MPKITNSMPGMPGTGLLLLALVTCLSSAMPAQSEGNITICAGSGIYPSSAYIDASPFFSAASSGQW
jgi:hypothetical protein